MSKINFLTIVPLFFKYRLLTAVKNYLIQLLFVGGGTKSTIVAACFSSKEANMAYVCLLIL